MKLSETLAINSISEFRNLVDRKASELSIKLYVPEINENKGVAVSEDCKHWSIYKKIVNLQYTTPRIFFSIDDAKIVVQEMNDRFDELLEHVDFYQERSYSTEIERQARFREFIGFIIIDLDIEILDIVKVRDRKSGIRQKNDKGCWSVSRSFRVNKTSMRYETPNFIEEESDAAKVVDELEMLDFKSILQEVVGENAKKKMFRDIVEEIVRRLQLTGIKANWNKPERK